MMLSESTIIQQITALRQRSPWQENGVHETDAEILAVDGHLLALTSDSLCEELHRGLLIDLYTAGWFSVLMSLSDLSAVGATPLGLLLGLNLPGDTSEPIVRQIYRGVEDCCARHKTFVLGGDTNRTDKLAIATTALGKIDGKKFLSRTPLRPDWPLYVSGHVGSGNLAAFLNTVRQSHDADLLQHDAQIQLGRLLAQFDGKAIDTSDGLLFTLNHLFHINEVGFHLDPSLFPYHPFARQTLSAAGLPCEVLALGEVGDYELLFAVPKERQVALEASAQQLGIAITQIGHTTRKRAITLGSRSLNLPTVKAQLDRATSNKAYMEILVREVATWSDTRRK
jgi:thiamine-monophosphate kinase